MEKQSQRLSAAQLLERDVRKLMYSNLEGLREDEVDEVWQITISSLRTPYTFPENTLSEKDQAEWKRLYGDRVRTVLPGMPVTEKLPLQLALSPEEQVFNQVVQTVKAEFEAHREEQIRQFYDAVLLGVHTWADMYNSGLHEKAVEFYTKLEEYVRQSSEPVILPLKVDTEKRFPGLVSPQAKKVYDLMQNSQASLVKEIEALVLAPTGD